MPPLSQRENTCCNCRGTDGFFHQSPARIITQRPLRINRAMLDCRTFPVMISSLLSSCAKCSLASSRSSQIKVLPLITPVAKNTKELKGLVIPLNSTEAIIVESRRPLNYDKKLISRKDLVGAVVYTLDSKVPYRRTPVRVVRVLKNQESVISNGYKI